MKEFPFLLERQRISSRLDFSQCAHNNGKLALLVHANEKNPAKIDIVEVDDIIGYHDLVTAEKKSCTFDL